jgi:hypothetical protein
MLESQPANERKCMVGEIRILKIKNIEYGSILGLHQGNGIGDHINRL